MYSLRFKYMPSVLAASKSYTFKLQHDSLPHKKVLFACFCKTSCNQRKKQKVYLKQEELDEDKLEKLPPVIQYMQDKRIVFNSFIDSQTISMSHFLPNKIAHAFYDDEIEKRYKNAVPLIVRRMQENDNQTHTESVHPEKNGQETEHSIENFPLAQYTDVAVDANTEVDSSSEKQFHYAELSERDVKKEIEFRMKEYDEGRLKPIDLHTETKSDPLTALQKISLEGAIKAYHYGKVYTNDSDPVEPDLDFGTADTSVPVSDVACGGCGALLQCQNAALPGFKPREMFVGVTKPQLRATVCQRCYSLNNYNIALQVNVNPESYINLLRTIRKKFAMVVLLVDLTDAPCSIHPSIMEIIGPRQPVVLVGTKVDLIPMDGNKCLDTVLAAFQDVVRQTSLSEANIVDTCLVSAHTGFGVEQLVSSIDKHWQMKGDVYLVGSTNVGKSSLFNALLKSDLCDAVSEQTTLRATTSAWPGTTLNMLKFAMQFQSKKFKYLRHERLHSADLDRIQRATLDGPKFTTNPYVATLIAAVGRTDLTCGINKVEVGHLTKDVFSMDVGPLKPEEMPGYISRRHKYGDTKWCYDTPGALQPDQCLSLFTHEELLSVLATSMIVPETFRLQTGQSLFVGGVGRLDFLHLQHNGLNFLGLEPSNNIKVTVFRSPLMPVTVVPLVDASSFYRDYLGSELLKVPSGSKERLRHWPPLQPTNLSCVGKEYGHAAADVVLSSAGWVSIWVEYKTECEIRAWTPGGRGAYLRRKPFLPMTGLQKGPRYQNTVKYGKHKLWVAPDLRTGKMTADGEKWLSSFEYATDVLGYKSG